MKARTTEEHQLLRMSKNTYRVIRPIVGQSIFTTVCVVSGEGTAHRICKLLNDAAPKEG